MTSAMDYKMLVSRPAKFPRRLQLLHHKSFSNTTLHGSHDHRTAVAKPNPTDIYGYALSHTQQAIHLFGLPKNRLTRLLAMTNSVLNNQQRHARWNIPLIPHARDKYASAFDQDIEDIFNSVLEELRVIRVEMTTMCEQHPVSTGELADLLEEARELYNQAVFAVRRHSHIKEEGVRVTQARRLAALEQGQRNPFAYCARRAQILLRTNVGGRVRAIARCREHRLSKLCDALDKVHRHHLLVALAEGEMTVN